MTFFIVMFRGSPLVQRANLALAEVHIQEMLIDDKNLSINDFEICPCKLLDNPALAQSLEHRELEGFYAQKEKASKARSAFLSKRRKERKERRESSRRHY